MKKRFVLTYPEGYIMGLSARHNGREGITSDEVLEALAQMNMLWAMYQRVYKKLDHCENEWWEKMEIERHYKESRWYYAHAKRRKLLNCVEDLHKQMFYLLVHTDGNYEPFGIGAMTPEEIHADFTRKYVKKVTTNP